MRVLILQSEEHNLFDFFGVKTESEHAFKQSKLKIKKSSWNVEKKICFCWSWERLALDKKQ